MKQRIWKKDNDVKITQATYDNCGYGTKGVWETERWDWPNWEEIRENFISKRTWMPPFGLFNSTCLCVEGQGFEIISDEEFDRLPKEFIYDEEFYKKYEL